ncbi:MAG: metalloregulator ArsR/SmtB family transcription factor [Pseudomonadota bacterium]|nr:metalloregulator ArsR/SmtB family transcription factor [Pseudomonadota bacterium]
MDTGHKTPPIDLSAMASHAEAAAALMKALSNPHRLQVLCLLNDGERSVGDLQTQLGLSQSALSQHLAVLRSQQLVATRRDQRRIYYRLHAGVVAEVIAVLHRYFCTPP